MQRVYGSVDEATLHRIDELAGASGLHRSEWVSKAIESYLHLADAKESTRNREADLQQRDRKILHLKELLQVRESEIQHLRSLTNDLRALVDVTIAKLPALPPGAEEARAKSWWQFWA
jgi:hypothetical protein